MSPGRGEGPYGPASSSQVDEQMKTDVINMRTDVGELKDQMKLLSPASLASTIGTAVSSAVAAALADETAPAPAWAKGPFSTADELPTGPFTAQEMRTARTYVKKKKAPGTDEITNEILLLLLEFELTFFLMLDMFNKCWTDAVQPTEWQIAKL